jgi:protein-export membrane protein SecD
MKRTPKWRIIIIVAAILLAAWYLYPTVRLHTLSDLAKEQMDPKALYNLEKKAIKLGLDLRGGMHLVMEVDKSNLTSSEAEDALDRALEIIRNRIDEFGVAEPIIQRQGDERIIIELPGLQDEARAKELIGKTALLEFKLLKEPDVFQSVLTKIDKALHDKGIGVELPGEAEEEELPELFEGEAEEEAFPELFEEELIKEEAIAPELALAQMPFSSLLLRMDGIASPHYYFVSKDNFPRVEKLLADPVVQKQIPVGSQLAWGSDYEELNDQDYRLLYLLNEKAELTGKTLKNAGVEIGQGMDFETGNNPYVSVEFNKQGARDLSRVSAANINKRMAIVLDGNVYSAPVIQEKIPGGQARISGTFTMNDARDLAIVLRAGALPAPAEIIEERTVGPSLGADSIKMGMQAAIIGFIIVLLFMIVYYKFSGIIANLALFLNIFFIMAVLAGLGATLTLPGIAGIILTIGMAVDANVLIFERIREELRAGKTILSAIDSGYSRAFRTILDANITTLITAIVLYQFGTGPIKGFAVTLSIGILASMFTAIVITRVVFHLLYEPRPQAKISI